MWGVIFDIDAQLNQTLDVNGDAKEPDFGEEVYGPFHGQVCVFNHIVLL